MAAFALSRRSAALTLVASAVALASGAASAAWGAVKGNGVKRTESRNVSGFTGISMSVPGQLEVRLGPTESVTIEADENILPLIETTVSRGTLQIRTPRGQDIDPQVLRIVVQARQIDNLALAGSGTITGDGLKSAALKIDVGGSGDVNLQRADVDELGISVGGSGSVKLGGKARALRISVAGSGSIAAAALQADDARISIAGSGNATVSARTTLRVSIAGSGSVRYQGDPKLERSIAGSGEVQRIGPLPS
jgi:hypothetical protein